MFILGLHENNCYAVARVAKNQVVISHCACLPPDEECLTSKFVRKMNKIADGTPSDIQPPTDDTTFERKSRDLVKLYQVSDESGTLTITEVASYPLKKELLDSKVCAMYLVCACVCMCLCT